MQRLSTATRLLEDTSSSIAMSRSVKSLLTLLESSDFDLGKGTIPQQTFAELSSGHSVAVY